MKKETAEENKTNTAANNTAANQGNKSQEENTGTSAAEASAGKVSEAANGLAQNKKEGMQNGNGQSYLEKFFMDMLKDIYWAEKSLVTAIPKMKDAATTEELKDAFEDHLYQTQKHVSRLEKVFQLRGQKPEGKKCEAMEGLTKEAESIIKETEEMSMTRDAALIIAAQKVEHYEIASYGGMVQLAITMGWQQIADILDKTLEEEEDTDQLLTDIAEEFINIEAEGEGKSQVEEDVYENA
ncbi:MAG TPA: ferritin-like domain-containing protein [Panacibacter sp.]|nr:ferritin-like domain-containing protein [Panacibacter sp.]HNP46491.1 ferritin-like domain-containing protein [Panacibacter sp.]